MYKIELTVETEEQKNSILELLQENEEDGVLDFSFNTLVTNWGNTREKESNQ